MNWSSQDLNRLYRYALSLSNDRDAAYDLLQGALLRVLETKAEAIESLQAYTMRVIRNLHYDNVRRSGRIAWAPLDESAALDIDFAPLEQTVEDEQAIGRLMSQMDDEERELLYLWAVEGYSINEICRQTGAPRGTLLARLHRLRRRLTENSRAPEIGAGS